MNLETYNILGNIINTTWGVGSTNHSRGAMQSVKGHLLGEDQLVLSFTSIISFGEAHERRREFDRISQDSASFLDGCIKSIKKEFKKAAGKTLKLTHLNDEEDYDMLSLGQYSGRKDAKYCRKIVLKLG